MLRNGATSYYQQDAINSVSSLSSAAGALTQTYTLDSFGKLTASSGSLTNPFQYAARESDTETGLHYYRARYYDQGVGRFISEDPVRLKAGPNFYAYVRNNAVNRNDPSGLGGDRPNPCLAVFENCLNKARCNFKNCTDDGVPAFIQCQADCYEQCPGSENMLSDPLSAHGRGCFRRCAAKCVDALESRNASCAMNLKFETRLIGKPGLGQLTVPPGVFTAATV
jgi:RHS repeat-associated protein